MLKLKLQYFGHLMRRIDSLEKTLMLRGLGAGGEGDDRGWDGWMASPTQWTWVWINFGSWWWRGKPGVLQFMGLQRVGRDWATELNWTERHSTGNCTRYFVINYWEKNLKKNIYMNRFAIHMKLTQYCKLTILQWKINYLIFKRICGEQIWIFKIFLWLQKEI